MPDETCRIPDRVCASPHSLETQDADTAARYLSARGASCTTRFARNTASCVLISNRTFSRRHPEFPPNRRSSRTTCCALWNIAVRLRFTHWRLRMIITPGRPNAAAPACVSGWLELQYLTGELHLSAILLAIERNRFAREFRPRFVAAGEHRFAVGRHPICGVN
jgi:hypothetical protein